METKNKDREGVGEVFHLPPQDLKWNSPNLEAKTCNVIFSYFFLSGA